LPDEHYLLFISARLAVLGPENGIEVTVRASEMHSIIAATKVKLVAAGFTDEPSLHFQ